MKKSRLREVLIGIDLGTTVLKAAAFHADTGELLASLSERLTIDMDGSGRREQDPSALYRALRSAFRHMKQTLGREWIGVAGIGLAAQGGSAVIADRNTGRPLTPMMLWNDSRAYRYIPDIAARKPLRYWRSATLRDEPGAGLGRLQWLQEHQPRLVNDHNIYAGAGEYLYHFLTGEWRQDAGNALQIGCYHAVKHRLVQEPLDLVGVPVSFFAPMREGHEIHPLSKDAARALDLTEGIPVAGPYMDHEAGYLAAIGNNSRPLQCSLGTAWVGNFVLPKEARWSSPFQLVLPSPVDDGWLVVQPLLTGNVTWDWALENFADANHPKALIRAEEIFKQSLLPPPGLAALPWLARPNPMKSEVLGGGAFFGLNPHNTREDMLRAVAAALVYEMARVFAEVKEAGVVDGLVLGGGASKGAYFQALLAAVFSPLPVSILDDDGVAGARGSLYGFSLKTAQTRTRRIAPPRGKTAGAIMQGYDYFMKLFNRLYADIPAGGPLHFQGRKGTGGHR